MIFQNDWPDLAEVYFCDNVTLGPMIALLEVGDELAELLPATFKELEAQGTEDPTIGRAGAMFTFLAVGTGNHVSLNAAINRVNMGAQIAAMHCREYAPGGIGVVLVNVATRLVTTYGGRGFPDIQECNPFAPMTISIEELGRAEPSGVKPVKAPTKKRAARKKKAARKKAARKKAAARKPDDDAGVVNVG